MSPLRYQKWLRLNEVRRPMLNEHYDVTTLEQFGVSFSKQTLTIANDL